MSGGPASVYIFSRCLISHHNIPKISLSMNKPPKSGNAKKKMLNHPTIISPLGVCTWKIAVNTKYNIEAKMVNLLPTIRLSSIINLEKQISLCR